MSLHIISKGKLSFPHHPAFHGMEIRCRRVQREWWFWLMLIAVTLLVTAVSLAVMFGDSGMIQDWVPYDYLVVG
jgi:hypothetical protein